MLNKLKNFLLPINVKSEKLFRNEDLLQELVACFEQNLEHESVGAKMLFPTSFKVFLNPKDYTERENAFPFVVQEVVNAFYQIILQKISTFPNYYPPSKTWTFRFANTNSIKNLNKNENIPIERGCPHIIAELFNNNLSNQSSTTNTRVTLKPKNSNVYATADINPEVFSNIDVVAKGIFSIKFDNALNVVTEAPLSQAGIALAELAYTDRIDKKRKIIFCMSDDTIWISGKNDERDESWVMKINSTDINNNHVSIKYDSKANSFFIAAFGKLRVNERDREISKGGDIIWNPLPKKATMIIGGSVIVEFESKR